MSAMVAEKVTEKDITEGSILCSTWGYDQTNVDFYEVIARTPKMVQLRKIRKARVDGETGYMTDLMEPIPGEFVGEVIRRKILTYTGRPAVAITSFANAYLWKGNAVRESSYA